MSKTAKEIVKSANPKFEKVYEFKECARDLKYIGTNSSIFENGKIYESAYFNGVAYKIKINDEEITMGYSYFERVS